MSNSGSCWFQTRHDFIEMVYADILWVPNTCRKPFLFNEALHSPRHIKILQKHTTNRWQTKNSRLKQRFTTYYILSQLYSNPLTSHIHHIRSSCYDTCVQHQLEDSDLSFLLSTSVDVLITIINVVYLGASWVT